MTRLKTLDDRRRWGTESALRRNHPVGMVQYPSVPVTQPVGMVTFIKEVPTQITHPVFMVHYGVDCRRVTLS